MVNPVGFRFCPTDEEIVNHYILPKNLKSDTSHVDGVISTVDICSCDPWDLPSKSMIKSEDKIWYFFGRKKNKYKTGDQQSRTTKSGCWTKTGKTTMINTRNGVKIGEKRVLVFRNNGGGSKSDWVIHEYHATTPFSSPNQMTMIYTLCRLEYKGDESEISSYSVANGGIEIEQSHYLSPLVSNSTGLITGSEQSSFELDHIEELQNPRQLNDFEVLYLLEETQLEDAMHMGFNNVANDDWKSFFSVDEQNIIVSMQEDKFVEFN